MENIQNISPADLYNLTRSLGIFLKTDVKVVSEMIERKNEKESHSEVILNPGCNIQVEITNTAPPETEYPLIVFIGVGLGIQFPKSMPKSIKRMVDEYNFVTDLIDAPQEDPAMENKINRVDNLEFEPITLDEQNLGYTLFPGKTIRYQFKLTYKECPDVTQVKLYAEGTISQRHLLRHVKEIQISNRDVGSKL